MLQLTPSVATKAHSLAFINEPSEAVHPHSSFSPEPFPIWDKQVQCVPLGPSIIQGSRWVMQAAARERVKTHRVRGIFWLLWLAPPPQGADPPRSRPFWQPLGWPASPEEATKPRPRAAQEPAVTMQPELPLLSALLPLPHPVLEQEGPPGGKSSVAEWI